jgi:hypothetical protein
VHAKPVNVKPHVTPGGAARLRHEFRFYAAGNPEDSDFGHNKLGGKIRSKFKPAGTFNAKLDLRGRTAIS